MNCRQSLKSLFAYLLSGMLSMFSLAALSNTTASPAEKTAVFAGRGFWGVDAVFKHVKGVSDVVSGYAVGDAATAHYEQVSNGNTGHAEAVRVRFNPAQVSYQQLLQIFFGVRARSDPTQSPRTGCRQPIPPSEFLRQPRAAEGCAKLYPTAHRRAHLFCAYRDASRAAATVLLSREVSPKLSGVASLSALCCLQRHAKVATFAQTVLSVV